MAVSMVRHQLSEDLVKIQDLFREGLLTRSVLQMWFIMWTVARYAAALSRRSY
jgi:hypothetical protein